MGRFALFFAVALTVLGGMHFYLWVRLVRDPALPAPWRALATVALVLLAVSVPVAMLTWRLAILPPALSRLAPVLAFTWLGVAFILFSAVLAFDLFRLASHGVDLAAEALGRRPETPDDPARRLFVARALAGTATLAAGGATAFAVRSATGPAEITELPVRLERLPRALSGYTLAQITDLHVGPTIGARDVRRVVEQTNALRADAVVITGDLVDGRVRDLLPAVAELQKLRARHGVYFVTGNHEYYSGVEAWLDALRGLGVRVLQNERVTLGDPEASFDLAGVDDWNVSRRGDGHGGLPAALAGRDPDRSLVLLAHQPRGVGDAVRSGVELQVSGHTHGGQIVPFNLLVAAAHPYVKGLHRHDEDGRSGQIFVSRGTGYWGPPLRLGSPPEIVKLVLTT